MRLTRVYRALHKLLPSMPMVKTSSAMLYVIYIHDMALMMWLTTFYQRQGDLWYFPPGIPHSIQALNDSAAGTEFLLVRASSLMIMMVHALTAGRLGVQRRRLQRGLHVLGKPYMEASNLVPRQTTHAYSSPTGWHTFPRKSLPRTSRRAYLPSITSPPSSSTYSQVVRR